MAPQWWVALALAGVSVYALVIVAITFRWGFFEGVREEMKRW